MKRSPRPIDDSTLSRRKMLKTAGAAAVGLTLGRRAAADEKDKPAGAVSVAAQIDCDVLVCGGGCAGLAAALAASRNGAKTILIERAGFAGGIITAVGLPYFDGIADFHQKKVVTPGIPVELFSKMGMCKPDATSMPSNNPTIKSLERFKLVADRLLKEQSATLRVLFHSFACGADVRDGRIERVLVANKAGLLSIRATTVIDATGDADIAAFAGAPVEKTVPMQPMSLHFRIGGIKLPEGGLAKMQSDAKAQAIAAQEAGELKSFYGPGFNFHFGPTELMFHAVRVPGDASDPDDFTRAEMQGREDAWAMFERFKKSVPGFQDSYFLMSGPYLGVRESRRIVGEYVLTENDIRENKKFEDAIASGCWYLDFHANESTPGKANKEAPVWPKPYDIPYRSLLPKKLNNLLVAGRCHSATQMAASSTRVTCTAMAMGQAAGVAGALILKEKKSAAEISGLKVREALAAKGFGPV